MVLEQFRIGEGEALKDFRLDSSDDSGVDWRESTRLSREFRVKVVGGLLPFL